MAQDLAEYIAAGKALNADERLEVAHQLLLSVESDGEAEQPEIDAAWGEVIDRRVKEIVDGQAELVDGREGLARIRVELSARRG
jgi:TolB-like protein